MDVTGGACIDSMGETVYIFLVMKQEEKKNIKIARPTRADNSLCGPVCATPVRLPKSRRKILTVYVTFPH